jgi:pimeloyl-ACP methyl ester carboxylesterase
MIKRPSVAVAGSVAGLAAGLAAERLAVRRRRRHDSEELHGFGRASTGRFRFIELADGAKIYVEETGPEDRRGVVFVHGSALRSELWHYQRDGFPGRRLVFYDLRGHGRSQPKGDADYTVDRLAQDLVAVIEALGLDEVIVVGHSLGGMLVLELSLARPELLGATIKGIALVNTTYKAPVKTITGGAAVAHVERVTRRPFDFVGSQSRHIESLRKLVRPSDAVFWGVSFAAFGPRPSPRHIDFAYDMLSETQADVIFDLFKAYRDFDVSKRLAEITAPALVVGGRHDRITVPRASEYLAAHLPTAELIMLDAGHMTMLERHTEFNSSLEGFLNNTLESPRAGTGSAPN